MLSLLGLAFLLGLVFNATPGAVFAQTVHHAVKGGFRPALAVQVGSLAGDAVWAVLGLAGAGLVLQMEWLRLPLGLASIGYLLWLARCSWREARIAASPPAGGTAPASGNAFRSGAAVSLANPQNLAFWAALGSAFGALGVAQPGPQDYAVFFAGFMAASVTWCFVCAYLVDRMVRQLGPRWAALTHRLCAAALLAVAAAMARDLLRSPGGGPAPGAVTPIQGAAWPR